MKQFALFLLLLALAAFVLGQAPPPPANLRVGLPTAPVDDSLIPIYPTFSNDLLIAYYQWPNSNFFWTAEGSNSAMAVWIPLSDWAFVPDRATRSNYAAYSNRPPRIYLGGRMVQLPTDISTNWSVRLRKIGAAPAY